MMGYRPMRDVWRCATEECGGAYSMTTGPTEMQLSSVDRWDTLHKVSLNGFLLSNNLIPVGVYTSALNLHQR